MKEEQISNSTKAEQGAKSNNDQKPQKTQQKAKQTEVRV